MAVVMCRSDRATTPPFLLYRAAETSRPSSPLPAAYVPLAQSWAKGEPQQGPQVIHRRATIRPTDRLTFSPHLIHRTDRKCVQSWPIVNMFYYFAALSAAWAPRQRHCKRRYRLCRALRKLRHLLLCPFCCSPAKLSP